ncbi:hypothetical protein JMJ35_009477 [Cladonia borealis]|uniref:Zn(2)-C6 fungal-type domain-containing protein n=1 Tax=Cladonia borealis TaxID=184061 RepID=A0AA39UY54_9LECA|nr:hypothetical protein JMJ35_009477 [Cladonia borealis]
MDPLEEFFTPEALRLLLDSDDFATTIDQPAVSTSDHSLSLTTPLATTVHNLCPEESKNRRKRVASDANIPGCSMLVLDKAGSTKPKRAKFSAEGRAKVASVRKKGACMRCHRNKIPCSGEWPCESCRRSRAVIAGRASRHRWMDCVPFSMKDLDIFASEFVQKDHLIDELLNRFFEFNHVHFVDIWLGEAEFNVTMKGDFSLGSLTIGSSRILSGPHSSDQWIVHSKDQLSSHIDSRLDKSFQILAATWLIEQSIIEDTLHGDNVPGLHYAQSVAGSNYTVRRHVFKKKVSLIATSRVRLFTPGLFAPLPQKSESRPNASKSFIHGYHSQQPLEKTSETTPPTLDQRKGDISQPKTYMKADAVSELKNDSRIVQRHATTRSPYLADPEPEDRYWTFGDHNEIDPAISTSSAVLLPELQPDTICTWCGCLQISYKPSQGVVSCDGCFTPYQPNDLAAAGWGLGEYGSTEPSFDPPSGVDYSQGELMTYASRPEVTASGSQGNDLDDFSWFMGS